MSASELAALHGAYECVEHARGWCFVRRAAHVDTRHVDTPPPRSPAEAAARNERDPSHDSGAVLELYEPRERIEPHVPVAAFVAQDPNALPEWSSASKSAGRARLRSWRIGGISICVRAYVRGGLFGGALLGQAWARRRSSMRKLVDELALSARLDELGVPTPRALGGWALRDGHGWQLHLATLEVPRALDVASVLASRELALVTARERRALACSLGVFVRRLHDVGLAHPDLQPRNVLLRWPRPAGPTRTHAEWWILDLDRAALRELDARARAAGLARLWRWWEKRPDERARVRASDVAAFWCGYAARSERRARCDEARAAFARELWRHRASWRLRGARASEVEGSTDPGADA